MIKSLKGTNGQIELHEDKIVINRKGLMAKITSGAFTSGAKEIMIDSISGIQFKEAGMTQGFIQFTIPGEGAGGSSSKSTFTLFSGTGKNRQQDENTVTFGGGFKPKETNKTKIWGAMFGFTMEYNVTQNLHGVLGITKILGKNAHPDGELYRFNAMEDFSHIRMELKYFF